MKRFLIGLALTSLLTTTALAGGNHESNPCGNHGNHCCTDDGGESYVSVENECESFCSSVSQAVATAVSEAAATCSQSCVNNCPAIPACPEYKAPNYRPCKIKRDGTLSCPHPRNPHRVLVPVEE